MASFTWVGPAALGVPDRLDRISFVALNHSLTGDLEFAEIDWTPPPFVQTHPTLSLDGDTQMDTTPRAQPRSHHPRPQVEPLGSKDFCFPSAYPMLGSCSCHLLALGQDLVTSNCALRGLRERWPRPGTNKERNAGVPMARLGPNFGAGTEPAAGISHLQ